jgi:hypothetical protein
MAQSRKLVEKMIAGKEAVYGHATYRARASTGIAIKRGTQPRLWRRRAA